MIRPYGHPPHQYRLWGTQMHHTSGRTGLDQHDAIMTQAIGQGRTPPSACHFLYTQNTKVDVVATTAEPFT